MRCRLEIEETAASAYYHEKHVNLYKNGIIINPGLPYLAVSPDYKVYDPNANDHYFLCFAAFNSVMLIKLQN